MHPMLAAMATRMGASVWARPALKLALALVGLVVLAGIGRTVTATAAVGGQVPPAAASASASGASSAAPPPLAPADAGASDAAVPRAPPTPPPPTAPRSARATADDPVFLNEAAAEDLRRLPGIGEKRAQAILDLRAKLGRFRQVEELLRVKGIGRATLKKLRPLVRLERPDAG